MHERRPWTKPKLITYGRVEDITRQGNCLNSDLPFGINNTSFPPGGGECQTDGQFS
jgi:hypothetical protein